MQIEIANCPEKIERWISVFFKDKLKLCAISFLHANTWLSNIPLAHHADTGQGNIKHEITFFFVVHNPCKMTQNFCVFSSPQKSPLQLSLLLYLPRSAESVKKNALTGTTRAESIDREVVASQSVIQVKTSQSHTVPSFFLSFFLFNEE